MDYNVKSNNNLTAKNISRIEIKVISLETVYRASRGVKHNTWPDNWMNGFQPNFENHGTKHWIRRGCLTQTFSSPQALVFRWKKWDQCEVGVGCCWGEGGALTHQLIVVLSLASKRAFGWKCKFFGSSVMQFRNNWRFGLRFGKRINVISVHCVGVMLLIRTLVEGVVGGWFRR